MVNLNRFLKTVSAASELDDRFLKGERVAWPPIGRGVHEQPLGRVLFQNIHCPARAALGYRVQGHACPITGIEDRFDRLFLNVIDPYSIRIHIHSRQDFENGLGAMGLVGKMRRMNEDELTMLHRHVDRRGEDPAERHGVVGG